MYSNYISHHKQAIYFHKNCSDGFFSAHIFLQNITREVSEYSLIPVTPHELRLSNYTKRHNFKQILAILDLPLFTSDVEYYFDHHITNENVIENFNGNGRFNKDARSTCEVLQDFFQFQDNQHKLLIDIANLIDQAAFETPPPKTIKLELQTLDDYAWACNDLFKSLKSDFELLKLWESFQEDKLSSWLYENQKYIKRFREKRVESLKHLLLLDHATIMIIEHQTEIQSESIHFTLAFEQPDLKVTIFLQERLQKNTNTTSYRCTFRQNPRISKSEKIYFRVDQIALKLGGGGHQTIASAITNNKNLIYNNLKVWIASLNVDYTFNYIN